MSNVLWFLLAAFHVVVFAYFVLLNLYYLAASFYAFRALRKYGQQLRSIDVNDLITSAGAPPVTVIVPTYNEEATCRAMARSVLSLQYPEHEVMIVNDGSTDDTLEVLKDTYSLVPAARFQTAELETASVRAVYRSQTHPNMWVVDKENGKRADAVNAGINYCRTSLLCVTDADGVFERDALVRAVRPFLEDERTVASGGIVRIANGCSVRSGLVKKVNMPRNMVAAFQVLDYLRAFLSGRVGWQALNMVLLISGAFGIFRRDLLVEMGGLATDSVGEDLELTIRLRKYCTEHDISHRITFVPDPVVWTEVPESIRSLGRQRDRWQRGLLDSMILHRDMLFNPRYGTAGLIAYPYFFFLEMLGPVIEFIGYFVLATLFVLGLVSVPFAVTFLAVAIVLGTTLSIASVGLEELNFRRYGRFRDSLYLLALSFLENLGFRQILTGYRFWGTLMYLWGNKEWGSMERKGFEEDEPS